MKASVSSAPPRSRILVSLPRPSERLESPKLAGHEQIGDHDDDRHEGIRRRGRQRLASDVVDHGSDELLARDQARRDVVPERETEREDRAGDDRREGEGEDDAREGRERASAEVR